MINNELKCNKKDELLNELLLNGCKQNSLLKKELFDKLLKAGANPNFTDEKWIYTINVFIRKCR